MPDIQYSQQSCEVKGCIAQAYDYGMRYSKRYLCWEHANIESEIVSEEELKRLAMAKFVPKVNKYHAVRTKGFDSAKEERRYRELLMLRQGRAIKNLECQVPYILSENPRVKVVVDFQYIMDGETILEDVKGIDKRTGKPVTLTACARVKYAWLHEKTGLSVRIV